MPCGCALVAYIGLEIWDGLPRTLQCQTDSWQNYSWGLHDIYRTRGRCTVAIASDGSRMNRCEADSFRHYFIPTEHATYHSVYLRSDHVGFALDDTTRTAYGGGCRCTWEPFRMMADDEECSRTAEAREPEAKNIGEGKIAGHRVVRYRFVDEQGTEVRMSLAPGLGCEVMEEVRLFKGTLGIPGAKWRYSVTAYKAGEPERNIFLVPPGYIVKPFRAATIGSGPSRGWLSSFCNLVLAKRFKCLL